MVYKYIININILTFWLFILYIYILFFSLLFSVVNVDQSKLSLISLGSCVGEKDSGMCLGDLGNIIIAKLNRHKHVPNKYV